MSPYTTAAQIAAYLGTTFTPEQAAQADVAASAVTTWIDHRTGRSWQNATGTATDEIHDVLGGEIFLTYTPVQAISEIEARSRQGSNPWEVVPPDEYILADPATGRVEFETWARALPPGSEARVDYTHDVAAPPADVAYAATIIAGDLLFPTLHPESAGLESLALGQNDISMKYARVSAGGMDSSPGVAWAVRVIGSYRRVVLA